MVGYSFLGDSFIRNSTPVYPDAICPFRPLHTFHFLRPARLRTPLLGYGAPHLSARGTSTLLNNALLSAHFLFADNALRIRQTVGPRMSDVCSSKFPMTDCGRPQRTLRVR